METKSVVSSESDELINTGYTTHVECDENEEQAKVPPVVLVVDIEQGA